MTNPIITVLNCETNEAINRPMTNEEYEQHKAIMADRAKDEAEAIAKASDKAALLVKLGITADEAALLLA
jgi:hypothetical protein